MGGKIGGGREKWGRGESATMELPSNAARCCIKKKNGKI